MDGAIGSLVNFLSMGALNYLVSMRFGVLVCHMFQMLLSHSTEGGDQRGLLGQTALIPLSQSTALVPLVTGVEPSTPVLLILRVIQFSPVLCAVVIKITSSVVGNFYVCGACTTLVLMFSAG